jgi:hypothetical protein
MASQYSLPLFDGVYRIPFEGVPVFLAVRAPSAKQLQTLLTRIIKRMMKFVDTKRLSR